MSLLFNMLSRLVISFLPRSKRLLISWLQSPSAVILEPPKIKSDTASTNTRDISSIIPQRRNDITRLRELFKDPFGLILSWEERGV